MGVSQAPAICPPHLPCEIVDQIFSNLTDIYCDDPIHLWTQLRYLSPYNKTQIEGLFITNWLPKMVVTVYQGEGFTDDYKFEGIHCDDPDFATFKIPGLSMFYAETLLKLWEGNGPDRRVASVRLGLDDGLDDGLVGNVIVGITDLPGAYTVPHDAQRVHFRWREAVSHLLAEASFMRRITDELLEEELIKYYSTKKAKEASITSRDAVPAEVLLRILCLDVRPKRQQRLIAHRLGIKLAPSREPPSSNISDSNSDSTDDEEWATAPRVRLADIPSDEQDSIDFYQSHLLVTETDPTWGAYGGKDFSSGSEYEPGEETDDSSDSDSGFDDSDNGETQYRSTNRSNCWSQTYGDPNLKALPPAFVDPHQEEAGRVCEHVHTRDWPCCRQMVLAFCLACQPPFMLQLVDTHKSMVPLLPEAREWQREPENTPRRTDLRYELDEMYLNELAWRRIQDDQGLVLREKKFDREASKEYWRQRYSLRYPGGPTEAGLPSAHERFRRHETWLDMQHRRMMMGM